MGLAFVVEDEGRAAQLGQHFLEDSGYEVRILSGRALIAEAEITPPSVIIISTSDGNGFDLCRYIRSAPLLARTPLILLFENVSEENYVLGLESGADDCLSKPFTPRELAARIRAVLRRTSTPRPIPISEPGEIVIDKAAMKLSVRGHEVSTTTLEFRLIDYLARHRGQVFTRDVLLDAVWGEIQFVTPRSVDACVRRVRNKIEPTRGTPTYLKTLRGIGYRFDAVAYWPNAGGNCTCAVCSSTARSSRMSSTGNSRRRGTA